MQMDSRILRLCAGAMLHAIPTEVGVHGILARRRGTLPSLKSVAPGGGDWFLPLEVRFYSGILSCFSCRTQMLGRMRVMGVWGPWLGPIASTGG